MKKLTKKQIEKQGRDIMAYSEEGECLIRYDAAMIPDLAIMAWFTLVFINGCDKAYIKIDDAIAFKEESLGLSDKQKYIKKYKEQIEILVAAKQNILRQVKGKTQDAGTIVLSAKP